MTTPPLSNKGRELIELYKQMVDEGYERSDCLHVDSERVFSDFELRTFASSLLPFFREYGVSTVLDYGAGGSNWQVPDFEPESGVSAIDFFALKEVFYYEPGRDIDQRQHVDCVVNFDVLEHVFIADVPAVLRDILSYANKLAILNVACYPAAAKLPNGENAHITVRSPQWWKGMVDSVALDYPELPILLICSTEYRKAMAFPVWRAGEWSESSTFVVDA